VLFGLLTPGGAFGFGRRAVIELVDVGKAYGTKQAVRGVSFTARPGEATGYLGPNGAGKTTTIKMIAGLIRPSQGEVRVCGFDVTMSPLEVKRRIGYVPESAALYDTLTPNEHLSLMAELHGLERAAAARRIGELLASFALREAADQPIESLSKGMRQKVLLSAALLHDPEVLLLDEPLNGLDVASILTFRKIIATMLERGKTILYCSHILDVIERVCARVVVINQGQIVADDTTANLLARRPEGTLESVFQALTRLDATAPESLALRGRDELRPPEQAGAAPRKRKPY
jgi:ABC-2 type transport system ATP-binding protein